MSPPPRGFLLMWLEVAPPPQEPCGPLPAVLVGPHCLPPQVRLSCLQILSPLPNYEHLENWARIASCIGRPCPLTLTQWFSFGVDFAPQWTFGNVCRHFWLSCWAGGAVLTGVWRSRPGMQLHILWGTGPSYSKDLSSTSCQQCWSWETLP